MYEDFEDGCRITTLDYIHIQIALFIFLKEYHIQNDLLKNISKFVLKKP